jgi:hypothetical protein
VLADFLHVKRTRLAPPAQFCRLCLRCPLGISLFRLADENPHGGFVVSNEPSEFIELLAFIMSPGIHPSLDTADKSEPEALADFLRVERIRLAPQAHGNENGLWRLCPLAPQGEIFAKLAS